MNKQQAELLNGIALAYIGDAIYEVFVREYLLDKGLTKPAMLQKNATKFVSAKAQAKIISAMDEVDFLTEYELTYFKRGRNAYRISTGFEAVVGILHLTQQKERLQEFWDFSLKTIEADLV